MRALRIDFVAPNRPRWPGWLLLACALLAGLACWQAYSGLQARELMMQAQLAEARKLAGLDQPAAPGLPATPQQLEAMQQARTVAQFLQVPWGQLFAGLETAAGPGLALLAVEPDARKGQLKITAEAGSKDALFDYMQRLEATPQFSQVLLLKHERQMESAQQPLRFILAAHWQETAAAP